MTILNPNEFSYSDDLDMAVDLLKGRYLLQQRWMKENPDYMRVVKVMQEHKLLTPKTHWQAKKFRDSVRPLEHVIYTVLRAIQPDVFERIKKSTLVWEHTKDYDAPVIMTSYQLWVGQIGEIRFVEWAFEDPSEEVIMVLAEQGGEHPWKIAA